MNSSKIQIRRSLQKSFTKAQLLRIVSFMTGDLELGIAPSKALERSSKEHIARLIVERVAF